MANQLSKKLKKELIEATGLKARQLSVRYEIVGYSDKLTVGVKAERFPLSQVNAIAKKYKDVDYCEASGEILAGGNTYISVGYPWDMEMSEEFSAEIEKVIKPSLTYEVGGCDDFDLKRFRARKAKELLMVHLNVMEKETYTEQDAGDILYKYNQKIEAIRWANR